MAPPGPKQRQLPFLAQASSKQCGRSSQRTRRPGLLQIRFNPLPRLWGGCIRWLGRYIGARDIVHIGVPQRLLSRRQPLRELRYLRRRRRRLLTPRSLLGRQCASAAAANSRCWSCTSATLIWIDPFRAAATQTSQSFWQVSKYRTALQTTCYRPVADGGGENKSGI